MTTTNAAPDGASDALLGTRYRLLAPLGRGGMGEVFEATHVALGKPVVVKLLHARHGKRPDLADRMRVEAQALALLRHPNLVEVTDFGHAEDGRTFLVMERLYGRTLRDELEGRGAIPVPEAVDILRQLLAGLDAVHAAGIVHRDVKPENIFLCASRTLKLLDFGLAKVIEAGRPGPAPLAFPTDLSVMLGTPRFFSPEQALGRPVDARSDLYSVGVVLYAMIAGRGPFDHYSALYELARAHASEPPEPPSRYARQPIPEALERVLQKALEKQPDDRFQTALAFSAALDEARAAPRRWQSTEKMPDLASILAAKERAIALKQTAPLVAREPALPAGPVLPFTAPPPRSPSPLPSAATPTPSPLPSAATPTPTPTPTPSSPTHLRAPPPTQSTRFLPRLLAFVLAALVSAIVFGSLATTVLLHAVR